MTRPGQDELNDETVRQLDAPDKEAQPATPRAPSSGMMSLSPPPGVLARSFLRYSLPPCMPGPLPERIHLPSDLLIPPELLQHPLPPAIPALNATLLPFVNTAPAGMVPAVQPQLQLPPSQLALMFLDNHDTTKAASGYNKEIWFWAPSKNLDIEQLLGGHEVSIEELSTFLPLHFSWPAFLIRCFDGAWSCLDMARMMLHARDLDNGDLMQREDSLRGAIQ